MAHFSLTRAVGCSLLALGLCGSVEAGQWGLILNGKSIHVDGDRDWNESNYGLGIEHEFNPESRWVKLALGNGFRDSDDEMSYMVGGGLKRRFGLPIGDGRLHLDVGAVGFVMRRHDVNKNAPFIGILPAFSVGTRNFAVNMTYLPGSIAERYTRARTNDPSLDGIVFVQFKLNARLLGWRGSRRQALDDAAD